nr:immunoglobulin heavy chain junction region [Mus musculus]MBK4188581.1 immunoglobulin heavy chain junction region [Mus musculus]MBK4188582.1 immunoglobulin heavy chain junction region [Mus musculus]MBK4188583.1 immunoglobulin heavy chain junction region [Mus musculus]MBK4188584.1 immunoglobulin heavy chain junction region [Mus musculus]
CARYWGDFW